MFFKSIIKMFRRGNVCVTGLRGRGKDLIIGNVIAREGKKYVSNVDYGVGYIPIDFNALSCSRNTYDNFIRGNIIPYQYPYPEGVDIFISDAGIYFPAQYCNELNKKYQGLITYMALSRQISANNVHFNVQNLNRTWDKFREQSDTYIRCRHCFYLGGLVIQFITVYDKYQSCVDRVKPCKVHVPLFNKEARVNAQIYRDKYYNTYGEVKNHILIYFNKSKHDTRYFKKLLRGKKEK